MTKLTLLSGAALLAVAGVALAQGGPGERPGRDADVTRQQVIERADRMFARLDANHDGRFTPDEARAMGEQRRGEMMGRMFDRLDANHDGNISREEFASAHQGMRGGPDGPGGPGMRHRRMMRMGPPPGGPGGPEMGPPPPGGPEGPGGPRMRGARLFGEQGFVTPEQMRARALERFDRADANHDGVLTAAERREARERMRPDREERRPN
jgi:Ca2+-binding EF-hand superfamily protein